MVEGNPGVISSPTTLAAKRLPDRTISQDKRLIADLRTINMYTNKTDYRLMKVPDIQCLAKRVAMLKRRFPWKTIFCTKRDIESAFRRINMHPDSVYIMNTELIGSELGIADDVMVCYLALPFGWNGSTGAFATDGDFIREVVCGYRSSTPQWESDLPFAVEVFADDLMLIEPRLGRRLDMTSSSVDWAVKQCLGFGAISGKKLNVEGHWAMQHVLLGFEVDVNLGKINLPDEKVEGARRLILQEIYDPGCKIVTVKAMLELRGNFTHWSMSNTVWTYCARPIDLLLGYADEAQVWTQCENEEIWRAYWNTMEWLRDLCKVDGGWKKLFAGDLDRRLPLKIRLSGNLDLAPIMWISTDATLQIIGVINWYRKQFLRMPVGTLFEPFMKKTTRSVHISDVEMLAIVMGLVVWVTNFGGTALNIADNLNALQWFASQKAQHGVSLQMLRSALKWIIQRSCDFAGLYSRSRHNVSADHLTRLSYEEIENWSKQSGFEWISLYHNGNWEKFIGSAQLGNEWEAARGDRERKIKWREEFGITLGWNPAALEVSSVRRRKGVPPWVSTPRHSVMDLWCQAMGINIWNEKESEGTRVFIQVGLAKTEFEILDFQFHLEKTLGKNAILIVPAGVGLPSDVRWEWAHKLVLDSCIFGDAIAAEWIVLLYMPGWPPNKDPS